MEHLCHQCGYDIGPLQRIGRRDACLRCGADLHCCVNCSFFAPTAHNQCREPHAERQVDKTVGNFCDFFAFHIGRPVTDPPSADARTRLEALFSKKK
jgi:hypothetical protein